MSKTLAGLIAAVAMALAAGALWWFAIDNDGDGIFEGDRLSGIDERAPDKARSYEHAPVLWVGEEFDVDGDGTAEPLSRLDVDSEESNDGLPERIMLGYGQCEFPEGEGGCTLPLNIIIQFTCRPITEGRRELLRGAVVTRVATRGSVTLVLLTDETNITIIMKGGEPNHVAESLYGANTLASHVTTDSDLTDVVRSDCRRG